MSKLDELMKASRGIATESMGRPQAPAMHRPSAPAAAVPDRLQGVSRTRNAAEIPVDRIAPDPDQPREEFDEEALRRLAESMRARGQLQPIRVRWEEGQGVYLIVCGERRWRAARMAGVATMTAIVMEGPVTPAELLSLQLVENMLREDLRPVEQAKAFRSLMDCHGWSTHDLARELAVDQSSVVRALKLLDLPAAVQEQVEQGALPASTAYEVAKLGDLEAAAELAGRAVAEGLTRADVVAEVRKVTGRSAGGKNKSKGRAAKPRKVTSRVFRSPAGKVSAELRKGEGLAAIADLLSEALRQVREEMGTAEQAAA
jgi:ParB family chromosome partitioning protein